MHVFRSSVAAMAHAATQSKAAPTNVMQAFLVPQVRPPVRHVLDVRRQERRIDLIFVPKPEFAFGYLGWVRCDTLCALATGGLSLGSHQSKPAGFPSMQLHDDLMFPHAGRVTAVPQVPAGHAANRSMHLNSHRWGARPCRIGKYHAGARLHRVAPSLLGVQDTVCSAMCSG